MRSAAAFRSGHTSRPQAYRKAASRNSGTLVQLCCEAERQRSEAAGMPSLACVYAMETRAPLCGRALRELSEGGHRACGDACNAGRSCQGRGPALTRGRCPRRRCCWGRSCRGAGRGARARRRSLRSRAPDASRRQPDRVVLQLPGRVPDATPRQARRDSRGAVAATLRVPDGSPARTPEATSRAVADRAGVEHNDLRCHGARDRQRAVHDELHVRRRPAGVQGPVLVPGREPADG
jgi:hypothetical protein